jgi:hypothetical protein
VGFEPLETDAFNHSATHPCLLRAPVGEAVRHASVSPRSGRGCHAQDSEALGYPNQKASELSLKVHIAILTIDAFLFMSHITVLGTSEGKGNGHDHCGICKGQQHRPGSSRSA